jgi:hypothetical protein
MSKAKKIQALEVEKELYRILGDDVDEENMINIMKKYLRTKNQVEKKGGCNCQNLEKIRGGFIKKLINKFSVGAQNVVRKINQKGIDNLRLLVDGEGPHLPTTNYAGPGTDLEAADAYGVVKHEIYGEIDKIAQQHDYDYDAASKEPDKEKRKQMILDADALMLERLDSLPEKYKNNMTFPIK